MSTRNRNTFCLIKNKVAKRMKGASSLFANTDLFSESQFKWSGSYGAFSVSRWDVPKIMEYIKRQKNTMLPASYCLTMRFQTCFVPLRKRELASRSPRRGTPTLQKVGRRNAYNPELIRWTSGEAHDRALVYNPSSRKSNFHLMQHVKRILNIKQS